MEIVIHRGTREIGGTCIEVVSKEEHILLDIGLPLDFDERISSIRDEMKNDSRILVEKGLLPDIPGIYIWDNRDTNIKAILISHPHLDHYGVLEYVKPEIPIIIGEHGWRIITRAALFTSREDLHVQPQLFFRSDIPINMGNFVITPYLMDHSAFDSYAIHLHDGTKSLMYTGDFRSHGRKKNAFTYFLKNAPKHPDALVIEGTMLSRRNENVIDEQQIEEKIKEACEGTANLVMGYCSGQNIDRIVSFYRAARKASRTLVVDIYTAHILKIAAKGTRVPRPGTFDDIKVYYPWRLSTKIADSGNEKLLYDFQPSKITKEQIDSRRESILMLVRPSVWKELAMISKLKGAVFIYSIWSGYLDRDYVKRFVDWLENEGVRIQALHTSGHADIETLKKTVDVLKPRTIIPVHTTEPEVYKELFSNVLLCDNKESVEIE